MLADVHAGKVLGNQEITVEVLHLATAGFSRHEVKEHVLLTEGHQELHPHTLDARASNPCHLSTYALGL